MHYLETTARMASFAWPSVLVLRGSRVVLDRTIVKCYWNENFASVLERFGTEYSSERVSRIVISSNERLVEPAHTVPLDAPIKLLETYGCHYVCYYLEEQSVGASKAHETRNVATVLMQSARQLIQPPISTPASDSEQLRGDHALRNDFIQYLQENGVGWTPSVVSTTGENFVKILTSTLWYLDPHHKQFEER